MTKDVLVSVRGAHIADGETNNLEVITAGSYYFKNGKHYIISVSYTHLTLPTNSLV